MRKAVEHLKAGDARMGALIAAVGPCRINYSPATYETVARSIVSQQLSGKAASTIYSRLVDGVGRGGVTPRGVLELSQERLRSFGLSTAKSRYLHALAESVLDGTLDFSLLQGMSDGEVVAHLTRVKGVGEWTAQMFLIFALRRRDVLPVGDAGIRSAIRALYGLRSLPSPVETERIAVPWRPFASVASWYLWRSLDLRADV